MPNHDALASFQILACGFIRRRWRFKQLQTAKMYVSSEVNVLTNEGFLSQRSHFGHYNRLGFLAKPLPIRPPVTHPAKNIMHRLHDLLLVSWFSFTLIKSLVQPFQGCCVFIIALLPMFNTFGVAISSESRRDSIFVVAPSQKI